MKVTIPQDKEWMRQREQRWDDVWEHSLRIIGISKQEKKQEDAIVAAKKRWYLEGDLTPLISACEQFNLSSDLDLYEVLMLCPIADLNAYLEFFQDHAYWLSQRKLSYWNTSIGDRDSRFYTTFFSLYKDENTDSSREIYEHMLRCLLPNETGFVKFPLVLGEDDWQPCQKVSLGTVSFDVLINLGRYLFYPENECQSYSHLKQALASVRFLNTIDPQYFDTTLKKKKVKGIPSPSEDREASKAGQKLLRGAIGNLLGYKTDYNDYDGPLLHNDPVFEKQLKDLIDSLDMPEEYHSLVEFIHAHPDDFVKRSE